MESGKVLINGIRLLKVPRDVSNNGKDSSVGCPLVILICNIESSGE